MEIAFGRHVVSPMVQTNSRVGTNIVALVAIIKRVKRLQQLLVMLKDDSLKSAEAGQSCVGPTVEGHQVAR